MKNMTLALFDLEEGVVGDEGFDYEKCETIKEFLLEYRERILNNTSHYSDELGEPIDGVHYQPDDLTEEDSLEVEFTIKIMNALETEDC